MEIEKIKFRAWNRIVNRFQYFTLIEIEQQKGKIQWHNLEIMAFTGLVDNTGKEIYEGDILDYCSDGYKHENGDVIFYDGSYRCRATHFHLLNSVISPQFKVVGNIYENRILLSDGK